VQTSINRKLEEIRQRLMDEGEEAWGPHSAQDTDHAGGEPGEGGATNVSDINDVFTEFMLSIAASLEETFGLDEDDAIEYVFDAADAIAEEGSLPFIPDEEDLAETAEWLGKAKSMGFGDLVLAMADSELGEEE